MNGIMLYQNSWTTLTGDVCHPRKTEALSDRIDLAKTNHQGFATQWRSKSKASHVKNKTAPIIADESDCSSEVWSDISRANKPKRLRKYMVGSGKHGQKQTTVRTEALLPENCRHKSSLFRKLVSTDRNSVPTGDPEQNRPPPIDSFTKPRHSGRRALCSSRNDSMPIQHLRKSRRLVLPSDDDDDEEIGITSGSQDNAGSTSKDDDNSDSSEGSDEDMEDKEEEKTVEKRKAYRPRYDGKIEKVLLSRTIGNNARELLVKIEGQS